MLADIFGSANLFFAGLLAGEEFAICYGVRTPLGALDERPQIALRQALIRRLRILVPVLFALTLLSAIAACALHGTGAGLWARGAGLFCLLVFIAVTLAGTVPINQAALTWSAAAPPPDWRAWVARWERLDIVRAWASLAAFGLFLAAAAPI